MAIIINHIHHTHQKLTLIASKLFISWKLNVGSDWLQYLATTIAITGVTLSIASSDFVAASCTLFSAECEVASVTKHAEPGSLGCR